MFVSGSQDRTIRFWDLRTKGCVHLVTPPPLSGSGPGNNETIFVSYLYFTMFKNKFNSFRSLVSSIVWYCKLIFIYNIFI